MIRMTSRQSLGPFQKRNVIIELPKGFNLCQIIAPSFRKPGLLYLAIKIKSQYFLALYSSLAPANSLLWFTPIGCDSSDQWKNCCQMISDGCFVILPIQRNLIVFLDMIQKKREEIDYTYSQDYDTSIRLFVFREPQQFCIVEIGKENITKCSYFNWSREKKDNFFIRSSIAKFGSNVKQMNSMGMLASPTTAVKQTISTMKFSFVQSTTEIQELIQVKNASILHQRIARINCTNYRAKNQFTWEMLFEVQPGYIFIDINNPQENLRFPMILSLPRENSEAILKPLQLFFDQDAYQLPFDELTKTAFENLDKYYLIKVLRKNWENNEEQLLLVNKATGIIEGLDKRKGCFDFCSLYGDLIYRELNTEYGSNKREFEIIDWEMRPKEAFLHILLFIFQNFDDDLLFDCVDLLTEME